jgi:hypothetical protein
VSTPSDESPSPAPEPPAEPGPPPLLYYRCPKGHEQTCEEEFSYQLLNRRTGKYEHDTGPMCYRCLFDFLIEGFQTRRIPPPPPEEVTPEQMAEMVRAADLAEMTGSKPAAVPVDIGGVEHYKCAERTCTVFISGQGALPLFCPDHDDANRPAGS